MAKITQTKNQWIVHVPLLATNRFRSNRFRARWDDPARRCWVHPSQNHDHIAPSNKYSMVDPVENCFCWCLFKKYNSIETFLTSILPGGIQEQPPSVQANNARLSWVANSQTWSNSDSICPKRELGVYDMTNVPFMKGNIISTCFKWQFYTPVSK